MKLTIKAENILEAIALQSRKELQFLLLGMMGMGVSQALITAIRLNVFDALQESPRTASELATAMNYDFHGMQVLLESLDGFGLIKRQGQQYRLTQDSARWLTKSGGLTQDFLRLGGDIAQQMILLEKDIRTGEVPNFHFNPQSVTCFANYYTMLKSSGQQIAPNLLKWAKFNPPPKRLLDVAGGPAEYSIAFCQKYPDLKADILDLPNAIEAGLPQIQQAKLGDRIQYIEGNLLDTDWGNNYDVVFLSNILHCLTAQQCEIALKKAFQALRLGGTLLINDLFHPGDQGKLSSATSLFSLIYYVTCGGRTWSQPTILDWLTQVGFYQIRTRKYGFALLVSAVKPN